MLRLQGLLLSLTGHLPLYEQCHLSRPCGKCLQVPNLSTYSAKEDVR